MQVLNLQVFNYRNFHHLCIDFRPGINLLFGRNGQGKTNLLEAVYMLAYGRSFRTSSPRECIRSGENECRLQAAVEHGTVRRELEILINPSEKKMLVFGKPAGIAEFVGNLHVLAFTQQHLGVVRGGPGERRAFLDRAMVSVYPRYVHDLAAFGRALKQRNRILAAARESGRAAPRESLESWDETLSREGGRIVLKRTKYVAAMKAEIPTGLFGDEGLNFDYASAAGPGVEDEGAAQEALLRRLRSTRSADQRLGFTSTGPHRDDLKIGLNGKPLADFGSAGQQRSCLLALYFAQMEIHLKRLGFYPVFLMDDVEAELDDERLKIFLDYLVSRTQTLLTTAKEAVVPSLEGNEGRFEIRSGRVYPEGA